MRTSIRIAAALAWAAWLGACAAQLQSASVEQSGIEQQGVDAPGLLSAPGFASVSPWPSQFTHDDATFTIYPPQLERWQGNQLAGRAAVSVQAKDAQSPVFGLLRLAGRTEVDGVTGAVTVQDLALEHADFPTAVDFAARYADAIRQHLSGLSWTVARERLASELAIESASREAHRQPLRNRAPRIFYSEVPAVLAPIDGVPELRELVGLGLSRVINTRALILHDELSERYFMLAAGRWMEARAIEGPWSVAQVRPSVLDEAKRQAVADGQVELLQVAEPSDRRTPSIFVSTVPAELVQSDGAPQYAPIQGTQLLYVTNSPNRIFLDLDTQLYYVLLAGRWYSSERLNASEWAYVPGSSLSAEFAKIPDQHPTASVREAVPGTPAAQEAVIANSVPQLATIKRTQAKLADITYDGPPQFQPIETTTLQYAVNSQLPVIRVSERSFYALSDGVWFVAGSPFGPWTVATAVPPVIYTIPPSSPLHYVTYVRIYDSTPETVQEGYTPGYAGSYVTPDNTVVYGTGWYYRPWIGSTWYEQPSTWGFGFSAFNTAFNTWWSPWPWSPWWGPEWAGGFPCFQPWWGPWIGPAFPVFVVDHGFAAHRFNNSMHGFHHASRVDVAHVFHRWGQGVATPFAARDGSTSGAPLASSSPWTRAAAPPIQRATVPETRRADAPSFGTVTHGGSNAQMLRHSEGHWQRFAGNGQWHSVNRPPSASPSLPAPAAPGHFSTSIPRTSVNGHAWSGTVSSFGRGAGEWANFSSQPLSGGHTGNGHGMGGGHGTGGGRGMGGGHAMGGGGHMGGSHR